MVMKTPNNFFAENTLGPIQGTPSEATSVDELKSEHRDRLQARQSRRQADVRTNVKELAATVGTGEKTRKFLPEHASKAKKAGMAVLAGATALALAPAVAGRVAEDQSFDPGRNNGGVPEQIEQNQAHEEQMREREAQAGTQIEVHEPSPGNVNIQVRNDS